MRQRYSHSTVIIPEDVKFTVSGKTVHIFGKRGKLSRTFKLNTLELTRLENGIKVGIWFGNRKQLASVKTICTHINNMVKGVTYGFKYKMRYVYAHFPITGIIDTDKKGMQIKNFLGEKRTRIIKAIGGATITKSEDVKDQIEIEGNAVEDVGRTCALIHQSCLVRNKDIRKFLDGIYVSEKGQAEEPEE